MNFGTQRPQVTQVLISFPLAVSATGTAAVPISTTLDKTKLITTFIISNPVAGSSVYLGGPGVQATGATQGLEIQAGTAPAFILDQEGRQLYELQTLIAGIYQQIGCQPPALEKIPFKCWDLTQLFLSSANVAGSSVTIAAFPEPYL